MKNTQQSGFSVVELLVVVAVILIVAAIAVPRYLSSKMAANEASAVGCMRTVTSALVVYTSTYPDVGYPVSMANLSDGGDQANCLPASIPRSTAACLIDDALASGTKSGYVFTYAADTSLAPPSAYGLNADPISRGSTGRRSFFTNVPGVIHWNATTAATEADPSIPM
jgi:type IV pilus assembly protein PilA